VHETQPDIDYAIEAMSRYANAQKSITLEDETTVALNNETNGAKGFFLKRSLLNQIFDDLQISNDADECLFIGFALTPTNLLTEESELHLVFQKAQYIRHSETMQKRIPNPNSPLVSLLSTLPHENPEASHLSPPPGEPYTIDDH
jgi:hypothetical protein